jgi:phosphoribosyl 1,2-cyclic phosphodiesterase
MNINAISLQSGSNGNCIYVEAGGTRLLFDAGISGIQAEQRLSTYGRDIREVDALLISHDHADHIRYAGVYQRKYKLPVYATPATLQTAHGRFPLGHMDDLNIFFSGSTIRFGNVSIQSIPTMHDSADGSAFVVSYRGKKLGIMTDLGHVFEGLPPIIASLDAVFIESNYDPALLMKGPYPAFLKKRISGSGGHISNIEAAELLANHGKHLKWACLAHLSENNNHPEVALRTHRTILGEELPLFIAGRFAPSEILAI